MTHAQTYQWFAIHHDYLYFKLFEITVLKCRVCLNHTYFFEPFAILMFTHSRCLILHSSDIRSHICKILRDIWMLQCVAVGVAVCVAVSASDDTSACGCCRVLQCDFDLHLVYSHVCSLHFTFFESLSFWYVVISVLLFFIILIFAQTCVTHSNNDITLPFAFHHDYPWIKLQFSFTEYRLFYRALLQKRPIILLKQWHHFAFCLSPRITICLLIYLCVFGTLYQSDVCSLTLCNWLSFWCSLKNYVLFTIGCHSCILIFKYLLIYVDDF